MPSFAEELAALVTQAFLLGVKSEAKKAAGKAGRELVKEVPKAWERQRDREEKVIRKASEYSKRYGRAFKRLAHKYKKKNGSWKKDGFKRAQAAAHREARKK